MVFGVMWLQEQTPKDMFLRDWIVDWNMIIIMGSIVNMILGKRGQGLHDHSMSMRILTLKMIKIYIWTPKLMRIVTTASI